MTSEWIERDGKKFQILYGYGRIQKARAIFYKHLPDVIKRAQIVNPNAERVELLSKASIEDIIEYEGLAGTEIAKLVLNEASDWDKSSTTVSDYVDNSLPPDVGEEIVRRVGSALNNSISQDQKKD